jgi:hypothetical protein
MYPLPQSRGVGRHPAGRSYCGCSRSRLGSSRSEKGTTKWPSHRAHSGGCRDRREPRMEIHCRLQPHAQKLLGPMGICRCEEWHTRSSFGNRPTDDKKIAQIILPRGRVNYVLQKYMADRQVTCVSAMPKILSGKSTSDSRHEKILRSGAGSTPVRSPNQESGPNASV